MKVFRIVRKKYVESILSAGIVGFQEGNRWNKNRYLLYTTESRALATLEISVHLDLSEDLPTDRFYVEIEIPADVKILKLEVKDLPEHWNSKLPILETQYIGDNFASQLPAVAFRVPSSIIPLEFNYLFNPNHPDFTKIKVIAIQAMAFGGRFKWK